jgi:hypothetical protein
MAMPSTGIRLSYPRSTSVAMLANAPGIGTGTDPTEALRAALRQLTVRGVDRFVR